MWRFYESIFVSVSLLDDISFAHVDKTNNSWDYWSNHKDPKNQIWSFKKNYWKINYYKHWYTSCTKPLHSMVPYLNLAINHSGRLGLRADPNDETC